MKSVPELSKLNDVYAWVRRINEHYPRLWVEGYMVIGNINRPALFSTFADLSCLHAVWDREFAGKEFFLEDKLVLRVKCSQSTRDKLRRLKIHSTLEVPLVWNMN